MNLLITDNINNKSIEGYLNSETHEIVHGSILCFLQLNINSEYGTGINSNEFNILFIQI